MVKSILDKNHQYVLKKNQNFPQHLNTNDFFYELIFKPGVFCYKISYRLLFILLKLIVAAKNIVIIVIKLRLKKKIKV